MHVSIVHVCCFSPAGKIFTNHSILINMISIHAHTQQSFSNITIDVHGKLAQDMLSIDDFRTGAYLQ